MTEINGREIDHHQIVWALEESAECCHACSPRSNSLRDCMIPTTVAAEVILAFIEGREPNDDTIDELRRWAENPP